MLACLRIFLEFEIPVVAGESMKNDDTANIEIFFHIQSKDIRMTTNIGQKSQQFAAV